MYTSDNVLDKKTIILLLNYILNHITLCQNNFCIFTFSLFYLSLYSIFNSIQL